MANIYQIMKEFERLELYLEESVNPETGESTASPEEVAHLANFDEMGEEAVNHMVKSNINSKKRIERLEAERKDVLTERDKQLALVTATFQGELDHWDRKILAEEGRIARRKEAIMAFLNFKDISKLKTALFTVWKQRATPSIVASDDLDFDALPSTYVKTEYSLNRDAIRKDWLEGREMPAGINVHAGEFLQVR